VLALGLLLHPLEPCVVVGKLVQVGERELARHDRIVIGQVRSRLVATVLEFDVHPVAELLEVEGSRVPVDAALGAYAPGIVSGDLRGRELRRGGRVLAPASLVRYSEPLFRTRTGDPLLTMLTPCSSFVSHLDTSLSSPTAPPRSIM
jgi:hypothetical protein